VTATLNKSIVPETIVIGTNFTEHRYPAKWHGFEGYFVSILVPKSKSRISCIIGMEGVSDEDLYFRLRESIHGSPKSG